MIRVFTSEEGFNPENIVEDNEAFFLTYFKMYRMGEDEIETIKKIDSAEIIDFDNGILKTPFGVTGIINLSTGCKTVLNYITIAKHREEFKDIRAINVTESGANAIEMIFEFMEKYKDESVDVILEHEDGLYKCKERDYLINGTRLCRSIRFLY